MKSSSAVLISRLESVPDLLALHALKPAQYPHFLNSAAQNLSADQSHKNRYDILFAFPGETLKLDSDGLTLVDSLVASTSSKPDTFLGAFSQWYENEKSIYESALPFSGGWFVYLSYEMAGEVEPGLKLPVDTSGLPVAIATRFKNAVVIDHLNKEAVFVSEPDVEHSLLLKKLQQDIQKAESVKSASFAVTYQEEPADVHLNNLDKIHRYIVDGDIFQANLSRLWLAELDTDVDAAVVYSRLRENNPSPFACLCQFEEGSIISSSPERLVSVKEGRIDTRPIAGTRPRGDDSEKDQALLNELISHPKERAEHIMLLDLERNDLGRVCKPGSIHVDELMTIETYQHVHHIVSNVTGTIRDQINPVDVIKAVFPGGTITGCPKVRCMEILAELEQTGRGAYTGSAGYINRNGDMDLNILIRTLVKTGRQIRFRAGGGIVVDSQPEHELAETRAKAKGMIRALGIDSRTDREME